MIKKLKIFSVNSNRFDINRKSILGVLLILSIIFDILKVHNATLNNSDCDINLYSV